MNYGVKTNVEVPNDCRVEFPYTDQLDFLNAFHREISGDHDYETKLQEIDSRKYSDRIYRIVIDELVSEYDSEYGTDFSNNWIYINAVAGIPNYQRYVADFFLNGTYGLVDYKAALFWLKLAVSGNDWDASFMACQEIAHMYKTGLGGIMPDPIQASHWLAMASNNSKLV